MVALADAFDFASRFCSTHGVDRDDALRLKLVVEELFTNTVRHGHGIESDATIRIALAFAPGGIAIVYEDEAPGFDPTRGMTLARAAPEAPPAMHAVGGLGLRLLGEIVRDLRYVRVAGRNRLSLTLPRIAPPG